MSCRVCGLELRARSGPRLIDVNDDPSMFTSNSYSLYVCEKKVRGGRKRTTSSKNPPAVDHVSQSRAMVELRASSTAIKLLKFHYGACPFIPCDGRYCSTITPAGSRERFGDRLSIVKSEVYGGGAGPDSNNINGRMLFTAGFVGEQNILEKMRECTAVHLS
ncbi:hypothetical protein EVAR_58046_1 [Eumeta japonica]|uniref:Uncharacterized protein n=1 Tax=Eumeta variegata TaxID=151549 RepID=A0A4C1YYQ5_EUMVA|nr:hypothetical protein EVAR_58046_1 [Eumeta japonica]